MKQEIFNGNNLELLKNYPDNYFDAIVTDPPYGLGKEPNTDQVLRAWVNEGYLEVEGSGFMGKQWDAFVPQLIFWKEVFRTLKHGGHVVSFFGTRTYDWGVMAMRLAGFEVRDCIQWIYGSGFPKSHNISKAIDKTYGASREVIGKNENHRQRNNPLAAMLNLSNGNITTSSTDHAKQWDGWGTALKPANEPIVLARKPLEKGLSIAENILKWRTGGINIDGSRISTNGETWERDNNVEHRIKNNIPSTKSMLNNGNGAFVNSNPQGRFPANLILTHHPECECVGLKKVKGSNCSLEDIGKGREGNFSNGIYGEKQSKITSSYIDSNGQETIEDWTCHEDCPIRIMDEQSGISKTGDIKPHQEKGTGSIYGNGKGFFSSRHHREVNFKGDMGGASRFFYCAKASKSERNKGLNDFEEKEKPDNYIMPKLTCSVCGSKRVDSTNKLVCNCGGETHYENQNSHESKNNLAGNNKNFHPTVKPVALMRYPVKMITPPNGIVLDPFNGSGTTGVACKLEGFQYVGLEQDADYCKISEARISAATENDYRYERNTKEQLPEVITNQLNLF